MGIGSEPENSQLGRTFRQVESVISRRFGVDPQGLLETLLLASVFVAALAWVQFASPALAGTDGYYHVRFADLMRQEGLKPVFPWLPLTVLNAREFYDHHFLFHVALIPFTGADARLGGKWASVLFASLAFLFIWCLLKRRRVSFAPAWALGLLVLSDAFLYRMSMVRAQSLSLAVLALGLLWVLEGRYFRLLPLGFIYVWLYDGFPLLPAVAAAFTLGLWLAERRLELRPLGFSIAGVMLGLLVNPYFPYSLIFSVRHILPKLGATTVAGVGNEWFPYTTGQLLDNSTLTLVVFVLGVLALGLQARRMDVQTATSLVLVVLFGWMTFQSRRFIEYLPPFVLIFGAFAWEPILAERRVLVREPVTGPGGVMSRTVFAWARANLPALLMLSVLLPGLVRTLIEAHASLEDTRPYERYAGAARWLKDNSPSGSRVFQTDWDDFPRLFYYNTHNTYLVGLDPTYLQIYSPELYDLWLEIAAGDVENPAELIGGRFGAQYVFSDLNHKDFIRQAQDDPGLQEVYRDEEGLVYRVVLPLE